MKFFVFEKISFSGLDYRIAQESAVQNKQKPVMSFAHDSCESTGARHDLFVF